ncbi:hypothetical protein KAR91_35450 [Candidatus Pacearchaeota archaeon]|nr:hypothetical protein [Candidatus Pacearchaeota archaeon]
MAKPKFELWANTLIDISQESSLNEAEKKSLREIAKELKKFQAIVEVTRS